MEEIIKPNSDNAIEKKEASSKEPVRMKKRSGLSDFFDAIRPKNPDSFLHHVIYHILIPSALNVTEDTLKDGIDHWLHPSDPRYNDRYRYDDRNRRGGVSYISYNNMYENDRNSKPYEPNRYNERRIEPNTMTYPNRQIADEVLEEMRDIIYETGFCSISEFYESVKKVEARHNLTPTNIPSSFADEKWGWTDLRDVRPSSTYDGRYTLRLPRTEHM